MTARAVLMVYAAVMVSYSLSADAASLFRCKAASGGSYWSANWCSVSGGYTVDVVSVPNLPFDQQVQLAEQSMHARVDAANAEEAVRSRARACASIDRELAEIWSRYTEGKYVPAEQVGPDQIRTRELRGRRSQLGCQSR